MKVLLVGANGQIGKHVIQHAKQNEAIEITAMVRKEEQAVAFNAEGTKTVLADLEGSVEDLAKAMESMDAVVFTAGSGGHTGADKTLLVDLDGAAKTIEAAEQANVERYVMISAFQAHNREYWMDSPIKPYMAAKHYADKILMDSKLNYTIIRPAWLTNKDEVIYETTEKGEPFKGTEVSRKSIGYLVADITQDLPKYAHRSIGVDKPGTDGDKPSWY